MKKILRFLDCYYKRAQMLSDAFRRTRQKEWNPLVILNELSVQVGHIYNIIYQNIEINEEGRLFTDLGDELSDVLLQLITLADTLSISLYHVEYLGKISEDHLLSFPVLFGQLNEAVMEKFGYRFIKDRSGFQTIDEFIENRILKLFVITYNIFEKHDLDVEKEFSLMLSDANRFLKKFNFDDNEIEYIDTYNENHDFIGVFERKKAHALGLWHDVVGCLIFNPCTRVLFLQLKSAKHNGISSKDLLEITVGGHLKAGEEIKDSIREVKEEVGLNVSFSEMIPCLYRKCDFDSVLKIREFQHYYLLPLPVELDSFSNDSKEVFGLIQLNIDDAFSVLQNHTSVLAKVKKGEAIQSMKVTIEDFDPAFIENGVFILLFSKVQEYIDKEFSLIPEKQKVFYK